MGQVIASTPEVKSLTFATLRSFLPRHFGDDVTRKISSNLPDATASILESVDPGEWIAETHMQAVLQEVFEVGTARDDDAFGAFARALAAEGISRFMGIFLSLASERFVLRNIPVVWKRLRRNAGTVSSSVRNEAVQIAYHGFPFFGDGLYRLLSLSNCQALVYAATGGIPEGRIISFSADTLVLQFELGTQAGR